MTSEHDLDARLHASDPMAGVTPDLAAIRAQVMARVADASVRPSIRRAGRPTQWALAAAAALIAAVAAPSLLFDGSHSQAQLLIITSNDHASASGSPIPSVVSHVASGSQADCASNVVACNDVGYASCVVAIPACDDLLIATDARVSLSPEGTPIGLTVETPVLDHVVAYLPFALLALLLVGALLFMSTRRPRGPAESSLALLAVIAVVGTGFAAPSNNAVRLLSEPVGVTRQGSWLVDLGPRPGEANGVTLTLTCQSAGTFTLARNVVLACRAGELGRSLQWSPRLADAQHEIRVKATRGDSWRLTGAWAVVPESTWGVNTMGATFGRANGSGAPDLVETKATNGRVGYVYSRMVANLQVLRLTPKPQLWVYDFISVERGTLPVFDADGQRTVGEIPVSIKSVEALRALVVGRTAAGVPVSIYDPGMFPY